MMASSSGIRYDPFSIKGMTLGKFESSRLAASHIEHKEEIQRTCPVTYVENSDRE